ncbi:hypothetical protein COLO4_02677 [Corchorus olitorius]|uniref:Uncharacterized protein n=1 Tax=Corchorus olitorius TaxID=93759 RepID=A0A1R3L0H4_9ROSI|nr:hypothetical protein COLO4_02677 [Corchorus olitorius]
MKPSYNRIAAGVKAPTISMALMIVAKSIVSIPAE